MQSQVELHYNFEIIEMHIRQNASRLILAPEFFFRH